MDSVTFLFDTVKFSFYKLPDFLQKKKNISSMHFQITFYLITLSSKGLKVNRE